MLGLPDFDYLARKTLDYSEYAYVSHGAGSESSYRNNLEVFNRFRFRPRVMVNITNIDASLKYEHQPISGYLLTSTGRRFLDMNLISPSSSAHLLQRV